ncbi:hypothetical protein U1Q18_033869 [Sarracenia purpurea var. burkii]
MTAAGIKPLPSNLEPYASKPASPKPSSQEKPPSQVGSLPPAPTEPQVHVPVELPPKASTKEGTTTNPYHRKLKKKQKTEKSDTNPDETLKELDDF